MKTVTICIGLAIYSLAGISGLAQGADKEDSPAHSASASTTTETETDVTSEEDGRKQRTVRIQRTLPGVTEVEEYEDEDTIQPVKPVRKRVKVIRETDTDEDVIEEQRIEVRPQIRVFPKERELVIRRGPQQLEMAIDLESEDGPVIRRPARVKAGVEKVTAGADASIEHLEQAIRHLRRAGMTEPAARLEAELEKLQAQRNDIRSRHLDELRSLREERDALREEVRKLRGAGKNGGTSNEAGDRSSADNKTP